MATFCVLASYTVYKEDQNNSIDLLVKEIISGCIRKDRASQHLLYKEFYSYCMGICKRYSIGDFEAADVLNNGFLKIFNNIDKYDNAKPIKAWIGKIMVNTAIDHYRANLRFTTYDDISEYEQNGTEAIVYEQMAYKELLMLVQSLSPGYRIVFNMYAIDGYTHEEIAKSLNISVGTSKSNLFKARQRLQEMIRDMEPLNAKMKVISNHEQNISKNERRA
ncbi:RNA polymerase sigma factor [Pedobacter sp. R20-19]|uniref:RNA polymerase sigma factor n=1 Tax=Pedobacter sp. R20-19 TaxID=1270196 RepID=UPI0018D19586|nr:sigma-70 family RNA polymerase sigma factor [Pedobacter sp. R20-19]